MATIPSFHPDSGGEYVSMPNGYADRRAATQQFDAQVFEQTGAWVSPQPPQQSSGVLGTGLSAGEFSLLLSAAFIAWRVL